MALITTGKTMGWYGSHGPSGCTNFSLPEHFGTYNSSGQFVMGKSGISEQNLNSLEIWFMQSNGAAIPWSLKMEKMFRNLPTADFILGKHDKLECGRMYWISYQSAGIAPLNIPNFTPSAVGVDMGRVSI